MTEGIIVYPGVMMTVLELRLQCLSGQDPNLRDAFLPDLREESVGSHYSAMSEL